MRAMETSSLSSRFPKTFSLCQLASSVWFVGALAAVLRLTQLGTESVWVDEMYSLDDAVNFSFRDINIRPFYYMLLKGWMMLGGSSDVWLRSLSVLLDLGAIAFAYLLCQYALGRTAAWMTALIMALSPLMLNHAQEIRMYPLITFLTLGGTLALAHALEQPTRKLIGLWAIARLLALLTSPLMILMFLPDCLLYGLTYWRKWPQLRVFLYGLLFIGATWGPLLLREFLAAKEGFEEDNDSRDGITLVSILSKITSLTIFWPLEGLDFIESPIPLLYYKLMTLVLLGVFAVALVHLRPNIQSRLLWIAAWGLLPTAVMLAAAMTVMPAVLWRARYLLFVAPYLIMLLVYGFEQIRRWQPRAAALLAALYIVAVGGGLAQYYSTYYRPAWQAVVETVQDRELTGDVIINYTGMGNYNVPRYYEGRSDVETIHLYRDLHDKQRLKLVMDKADELPQAERMWLICQAGCQEQKEFQYITEAVVGANAQTDSSETFETLGNKVAKYGAIDLHLVTSGASD